MRNKKGMNFFEGLLLFVLIVGTLFELTLMIIAWQYADRVKCNLLWCVFTKESSFVIQEGLPTGAVNYVNVDTKNSTDIQVIIPSSDFVSVVYNDTRIYCFQNHSQVTCYSKEYYIE